MDPLFDRAWFIATLFGTKYADTLTDEQYAFAFILAENELQNVKCWCPKVYRVALSIKISLLLDGARLGLTDAPIVPDVELAGGTQEAYVIEDEVYDVRRKYKLVKKAAQVVSSGPAAQLERIIITCQRPLAIGAFLAGGINSATGGCCGSGDSIGDKAEFKNPM